MDPSTDRLIAAFRDRYRAEPRHLVRAPGRVNLIGEHTDYSLLPVMPFAIDREVLIAMAPGDSGVEIDSLSLPAPIRFPTDGSARGWHRYVQAAMSVTDVVPAVRLLVGGTLPSTGGLSSSSALTMGVVMALHLVRGESVSPHRLAERSVAAERSIGVEGGQMDQLVIALAVEDHALRIDFDPVVTHQIPLPEDLAIVVAYSGQPAPKAGSVNDRYNTRVVASRAGACLLAAATGVDPGDPPSLSHVRSTPVADADLPEEATAREVATTTGVELRSIVRMTQGDFSADSPLPIGRVVRHILSEADRVDAAQRALEEGRYNVLGALLDESHTSLRNFGASSDALDHVTQTMKAAGAHGARLTGAGFGRYAICVCSPEKVDGVLSTLHDHDIAPSFEVRAVSGVSVVGL